MPIITAKEIQRCRSDFRYFCRHYLKIKPKRDDGANTKSGLAPFIWNHAQEIVWSIMEDCIREERPIQLVICKARQVGISTLFMAWCFWRMWRSNYITCGLASAQKPTYVALVEMMNIFYDNMPDEMKPKLRNPKTNAKVNIAEIEFIDQHCKFTTGTAKADAFRGNNIDVAICTEVASYKDPLGFFDGFLSTLSESPLTTFVMESSPQDGFFRTKYDEAKDGKAGGAEAVFLPWWILPNPYSKPLFGQVRKKKLQGDNYMVGVDAKTKAAVYFDEEEIAEYKALNALAKKGLIIAGKLIACAPVSWEQMYWRKAMIEKNSGDIEWFNTECPRDDVSCFMRNSSSAFRDVLPIVRASVEETPGMVPGLLFSHDNLADLSHTPRIEFMEALRWDLADGDRYAGLHIYDSPEPGYTYTIGVDVCQGLGQGTSDEDDHAASVMCVYCCDTREQVAEYRARNVDPFDLGDEAVKLGYYYNTAMLCVELNNGGISTVDRVDRNLNYPNIFMWPKFEGDELSKKRHWQTDTKTKPLMINTLRYRIRLGHFIVRSQRLESEMSQYVVKNSVYKNTNGDSDCIIAASLAWQCVEQTPFKYEFAGLSIDHHPAERHTRPGEELPPNMKPIKGGLAGISKAAGLSKSEDLVDYFIEDIWGARSALV